MANCHQPGISDLLYDDGCRLCLAQQVLRDCDHLDHVQEDESMLRKTVGHLGRSPSAGKHG